LAQDTADHPPSAKSFKSTFMSLFKHAHMRSVAPILAGGRPI
jgi:hypothetical protein